MWQNVNKTTLPSAADYSTTSKQLYCFSINSSGQAVLCSSQGQRVDFILMNKPNAANKTAELFCINGSGRGEVMVDEAVVVGAELTCAATGLAEAASSSDFVFGIALEASSASGNIITFQAAGPYIKA